MDVVLRGFLVVIHGWFVANKKKYLRQNYVVALFFESSRQPRNQIANVNFLLIPEASGGLHRARCFGGLQFAQICVECV
jgi:hypothetical protein